MLTIHREMLQGSPEWDAARRGLLTASRIGALITTKPPSALDYGCPQCNAEPGEHCWSMAKKTPTPVKVPHSPRATRAAENPDDLPQRVEIVDSDTSRALVAQIVAERLTEWEDPLYGNADMDRGHQVEPVARDWYAQHTGCIEVEQVGFMVLTLDSGIQIGYSPDGLIDEHGLLEVKAPRAKRHVLAHVEGKVPAEHMAQCQTGMFVAGRSWCDFVSYVGGEAPFLKRVHADPDWFNAIERAVDAFEGQAAKMTAAYETATAGIAKTDRLPDPYDAGIVI